MRCKLQIFLLIATTGLISCKLENIKEKQGETHADATKLQGKDAPEHVDHKKAFIKEFEKRRAEHKTAVDSTFGISPEKRRPFIEDVYKNIQKILAETRETLERISYQPTKRFPDESETLKTAISKVLENTAFFSDLSLHFSRFSEKTVAKNRKFKTLLVWAYNFCKSTGLLDQSTENRVDMMAQQHGIVEKPKDFVYKFDRERTKEELEKKSEKKRKAQKDKTKKPSKKDPKGEL